ncbi:hypothetical protein DFH27DRAFT_550339 [Peziza echinospora]|nr:hypothetical protein DFH27DRAFT_550339 [Peziza echinospora]
MFVHALIQENAVPAAVVDGVSPDLDDIWLCIVNDLADWETMFASLDGRRHLAYGLIGEALRRAILIKKPIDDPGLSYAMDAFLASVAGGPSEKDRHRWVATTAHLNIFHPAAFDQQSAHIGHPTTYHNVGPQRENEIIQPLIVAAQGMLATLHRGLPAGIDQAWVRRNLKIILLIGRKLSKLIMMQLVPFTFIGVNLRVPDAPPVATTSSQASDATEIDPDGDAEAAKPDAPKAPEKPPPTVPGKPPPADVFHPSGIKYFERPTLVYGKTVFDPDIMEEMHITAKPQAGDAILFYAFPGLVRQDWDEVTGRAQQAHVMVKISVCCCDFKANPALWRLRPKPQGNLLIAPEDPVPLNRLFNMNDGYQAVPEL